VTPSTPNPTWYDVLGVSRDASPAVIKAAWRNATDKFEPGSGSGQFRMFNEAADVLLDPERRAAYDATLDGDGPPEQPPLEEPAHASLADTEPSPPTSRAQETAPTPAPPPPASAPESTASKSGSTSGSKGGGLGTAVLATLGGLNVVTLGILALLTVAVLVAAAFAATEVQQQGSAVDARNEAPAAAEQAAKAILSYDYRRLPTDRKRAEQFLTASYQKQYDKTFTLLEKQQDGTPGAAIQTKTSVSASVLGSGVMDADSDTARVLVFVNQVSTRPGRDPQIFQNRVAMTMKQVEDRWLVDSLKSY
jgi:Mce-associated membrane protein